MDSDHLLDVMGTFDENNEASQDESVNMRKHKSNRDSNNIEIREEIDDAEPTFYNDATKIELQVNEPPVATGIHEEEIEGNRNTANQKNKR